MNKSSNEIPAIWRLIELGLALIVFPYFLFYPRDTLSDFIVLSILCIIVFFLSPNLKLQRIKTSAFSKEDIILIFFTSVTFICIFVYAFLSGKVNIKTILASIAITIVYIYYAFIQHFMAQRYLALRVFKLCKNRKSFCHPKFMAAVITGIIFGLLHIVYPYLMLPSAIGGAAFAYYYLKTGRLWAVVLSHAIMSSAALFWIMDKNPFTELIVLFD